MQDEMWVAHDAPERPFGIGMWLDDCNVCLQALEREARERPRLVLCVKTSADRLLVTAERLWDALSSGQDAESLCYVADDWVREIFVVSRDLPPGVSWWSLTLAEQTGVATAPAPGGGGDDPCVLLGPREPPVRSSGRWAPWVGPAPAHR